MKFKTVAEAFNFYRNKSVKELEERAQAINADIDSNPNTDIEAYNIELKGIKEAKENIELRSSNQGAGLNLVTGRDFKGEEKKTFTADDDVAATPEYRSAFYKSLLGKELTDGENRAFAAAQAEKRADAFNTLSNSAAVIPTTTLNEVVKQARGVNGLYNEIRLFSVPNNLSVPVGTPTDAAAWHTEGAAVERKNVTTAAVTFTGRELIKILSMSAAVKRMDTAAFERYLTDELKSCIADAIGAAIVSGTGNGQPTGILSGITWNNKNRIQTAELTADNLLAAVALLPAGYAGGAKFAMSTATLFGSVYPLKDGENRYFFTDPERGGVRRLFGFEIVLDDNIPAGTILFGNFRYYGVNIPQGVAIEVSRESGFTSGLIDYRALCIADGKPIVPGAFVKVEVQAA